ncbi:MAG: transcription elongation factor GreB [Pseudomonadota bacterium]
MSAKVYITPGGARKLRDELNHLWRVKRPEVTQKVAAAAALGDRSENADYIYGKKALREIDKRIRYLTKRLDNLEIVERKPADQEKIFFGAWIRLEDEEGQVSELRIVGADEFDLSRGWISLNSPMARSLLGKRQGDDVIVQRPKGQLEAYIAAVAYEPFGGEVDPA